MYKPPRETCILTRDVACVSYVHCSKFPVVVYSDVCTCDHNVMSLCDTAGEWISGSVCMYLSYRLANPHPSDTAVSPVAIVQN